MAFVAAQEIRKVYPDGKLAVKSLSFGVPIGQCFGFLGINGAGKTSTLKILSGEQLPTSGTASIAGFDILTQQLQLRRLLGYFHSNSARRLLSLFYRAVLCIVLLIDTGSIAVEWLTEVSLF